jgi:hypothetical protein
MGQEEAMAKEMEISLGDPVEKIQMQEDSSIMTNKQ